MKKLKLKSEVINSMYVPIHTKIKNLKSETLITDMLQFIERIRNHKRLKIN